MNFQITNQEEFDNRPLLAPDVKKAWVEALRSGRYEQGKKVLKENDKYCCLGVLCEINGQLDEKGRSERSHLYVGKIFAEKINLPRIEGSNLAGQFVGFTINELNSLACLNDIEHFTFTEIADVIELYF